MNQAPTIHELSLHTRIKPFRLFLYLKGGLDESSPYKEIKPLQYMNQAPTEDKSNPGRIKCSPTNYSATRGQSPVSIFQTI